MTNRRAERQVRTVLRPQIKDALTLCRSASKVIRAQAAHFVNSETSRPYERVLAILCARVADDLRAIHDLVGRGQIPQAMTLGATVFELAYSIGYVGISDDRAQRWLNHSDMRHLPWLTKESMAETVQRALRSSGRRKVDREQQRYQALCAFKHGNPALQKKLPVFATPESFVVESDPQVNPSRVRTAKAAIWLSIEPVVLALWVLENEGALAGPVRRSLRTIEEQYALLDATLTRK